MSKWTPGPWRTDFVPRQEHGAIGIFNLSGIACVALVVPGCLPESGHEDAARANAALIAAAPEMAEALRDFLAAVDVWNAFDRARGQKMMMAAKRKAELALTKAEGKEAQP